MDGNRNDNADWINFQMQNGDIDWLAVNQMNGNDNDDDGFVIQRQDANPEARAIPMDRNWWVAALDDNGNDNEEPVGRMEGQDWDLQANANIHQPAIEEQDDDEHAAPVNLAVDYTISFKADGDGDPRIEHVPPLSRQYGDQICEIALDGRHIMFHRHNDGNWTDETIEFPEGFNGQCCRFFDAAGTLCVMVFEADGVNTLIYDFHSGQLLGGGPMPEAINWVGGDCLRKVVLLEGVGLQVVITREAVGIHTITIGI